MIAINETKNMNASIPPTPPPHPPQVQADPETSNNNVIELLYILGLSLKADIPVSNLSGGEKKRLSIGLGMVSGEQKKEKRTRAIIMIDSSTLFDGGSLSSFDSVTL